MDNQRSEGNTSAATLNKRWLTSPGVLQEVENGPSNDSWNVIVCGFNKYQMTILPAVCFALLVLFLLTICLLRGLPERWFAKLRSIEEPTEEMSIVVKIKGWVKKIQKQKYIKIILYVMRFVKNLHVADILVGLGLYNRGDIWWAGLTWGIIVVIWLVKLISFLVVVYLCNKSEEETDEVEFVDPFIMKKKKISRNFFIFVSAMETLALIVLYRYIMTELLGSNHIHVPSTKYPFWCSKLEIFWKCRVSKIFSYISYAQKNGICFSRRICQKHKC
jgi:hypothetical protein